MRTPKEVFNEMCPCHGELWMLTETGFTLITKGPTGSRYTKKNQVAPLDVQDMLKVTGLTWCYRHWLSGEIEPLISKQAKEKLEQEHSLKQLHQEKLRYQQEHERRLKDIGDATETLRQIGSRILNEFDEKDLDLN